MGGPTPSRGQFATALGTTFASIAFVRSPSRAAEFTFKIGNNVPVSHPRSVNLVAMANAINRESGGRIQMQVFPNNQLGGDASMFSQLRLGALQFVQIDSALIASVVPSAGISALGCVFKNYSDAYRVMDGPVGDYVRKDMATKNLIAMRLIWDGGMREITSATHPIRTIDDLQGFKVRTPSSQIWLEFFKTLGANPSPIEAGELYTALQTKLVDGQDIALLTVEAFHFYEVQKYLSLTNHMWAGCWVVANGDVWKSLPPDLQAIIERNNDKYCTQQRRDIAIQTVSIIDKLQRRGMVANTADISSFRARLTPYYAHWKTVFGPTLWGLLETAEGTKLG